MKLLPYCIRYIFAYPFQPESLSSCASNVYENIYNVWIVSQLCLASKYITKMWIVRCVRTLLFILCHVSPEAVREILNKHRMTRHQHEIHETRASEEKLPAPIILSPKKSGALHPVLITRIQMQQNAGTQILSLEWMNAFVHHKKSRYDQRLSLEVPIRDCKYRKKT